MREGAEESSRPNIGRKPKTTTSARVPDPTTTDALPSNVNNKQAQGDGQPVDERGKIQNARSSTISTRPVRSTRNPNPAYVDAITAA